MLLRNGLGTQAFDFDDIKSLTIKFRNEKEISIILTTKSRGQIIEFDKYDNVEEALNFLRDSTDKINEHEKNAEAVKCNGNTHLCEFCKNRVIVPESKGKFIKICGLNECHGFEHV